MPLRRAMGVSLACLVTSACAIGEIPETAKTAEDGTSQYPGEASGKPRQHLERGRLVDRGLEQRL